jgi:polysaccharide export outer membrane protein
MRWSWVLTVACAVGACSTPRAAGPAPTAVTEPAARPTSIAGPAAAAPVRPVTFRFAVGDEVAVAVWREPELATTQRVQPDGTISPMLVGSVSVAGATPDDVRGRLTKLYAEYLQDPKLTVRVVSVHSDRVFILGEVRNPVAAPLVGPTTTLQAVAQAGGFAEESAEKAAIRVVRLGAGGRPCVTTVRGDLVLAGRLPDVPLERGDIVYVPARGVTNWSRSMGQALAPFATVLGTAAAAAAIVNVTQD